MMVSARGLLLGVYTSNSLIMLLFLPLCYLILLSPFISLCIWKFDLDQKLLQFVPTDYKTPDIWPQVFISLVGILLATRYISGKSDGDEKNEGKRRVQLLPYWVLGVRHWCNAVFGGESWLRRVADSTISSIFAYSMAGSKHNVILSTSLFDQLVKKADVLEESELDQWIVLQNTCNMPKNMREQYLQIRPSISKTLDAEIFSGKQMKQLISASLSILSDSLPDLITFNSSIVDQMAWERVANLDLTDGTVEVECELFALINEFFCNAILPPITGSSFPESYQLLATDLATFNQSFFGLAMGFPRFFPMPGLPTASLARKRLFQNLVRFLNDLTDPPVKRTIPDDESLSGEEEMDAETPTPLSALNDIFSQHDLPIPARAAIALKVLHEVVSEAVPLAFWTLLHIYSASTPSSTKTEAQGSEPTPLDLIREETKGWAEAIQPPSIHPSFPAPPEISYASHTQLLSISSLPFLRSCISESRRFYTASLTTAKVTKPAHLYEPEATRPGVLEQWELDVGSYIDVGISQTLINTSSANYLTPRQFKHDRFLNSNSPPPGISSPFSPSTELTEALLMSLVAGVVQLWDISAAPKKTIFEHMQAAQAAASGQEEPKTEKKVGVWMVPKAVDGASVKIPQGEIRVRIRRREGLDGPSR
ncbi:uncharacterized protein BDR25DRAFT_340858 [Lindgomyces ingoldianus]|uniref:Uncharacterized protein n=1 Tax=Lindgomyces ingoldianus TaxID=673940 RepID=A0ACB6R753_9PLEO|nr:uncharacterized protein BDR25DRAFT_340858 [Lindgomyces ingoldianus]KAF2474357.1 hypothetical protein BDR25DRAFT_340858 [Lindgomyces ingoldianus]